jgi:HlyD family secretion protein
VSGIINISGPPGDRIAFFGEEGNKREWKAGDEVKPTDVLVTLQSWYERKAALDYARTQLREAEARKEVVKANGQALVDQAELKKKQLDPLRKLDLQVQKAKVDAAQAQLTTAQAEYERVRRLRRTNPNTVSQQEVDQQKLAFERAGKELEAENKLLTKLTESLPYEEKAVQADLDAARASKKRGVAEIPIESLKKNVELAELRVQQAQLRAPQPGRILQVLMRPGETLGNQPILRMGDTRQMYVIAEVYETEVKRLSRGDEATVTSNTLPTEKPLKGKVHSIGTTVGKNRLFDLNPTERTDARVVEVRILLEKDAAKVASNFVNLQVTVKVTVTKK